MKEIEWLLLAAALESAQREKDRFPVYGAEIFRAEYAKAKERK